MSDPVPAGDPQIEAFARFIKRAIDGAIADGMASKDIEARTGVGASTFYRWARGESSSPDRRKVEKFLTGLGISIREAGQILGWGGHETAKSAAERLQDPLVIAGTAAELAAGSSWPHMNRDEKRESESYAHVATANAAVSMARDLRKIRELLEAQHEGGTRD